MKRYLFVILLALKINANAQGYFELKFSDEHTEYFGLLMYYDDYSSLNKMRIYYNDGYGEKIIIEQKIRIEYNDSLGTDYRIMHGYDVKYILNNVSHPARYFPDKFLFKKKNDNYYEPDYTTSNMDEVGLVKGRFKYFKPLQEVKPKILRRFGWDKPYGNSNSSVLIEKIKDFDNKDNLQLSRVHKAGLSQVIYEPDNTTINLSPYRDFSNDTTYLIIVSNTIDDELGESCRKNESGVDKYFSSIVQRAGGKLIKKLISGTDFSLPNLNSTLSNLKVGSSSGIVLYYSGHGFRPSDAIDSLPYLDFRRNHLVDVPNSSNSKNLRDVYQDLKNKNPRFCLVIAECCNNDISVQTAQLLPENPKRSLRSASAGVTIREELAKQLLGYSGSLLIATASPNQLTYYYPEDGGVFWKNLRDRMHSILLYSENPNDANWLEFFKYSAQETDKFLRSQDGTFLQIPVWVY